MNTSQPLDTLEALHLPAVEKRAAVVLHTVEALAQRQAGPS